MVNKMRKSEFRLWSTALLAAAALSLSACGGHHGSSFAGAATGTPGSGSPGGGGSTQAVAALTVVSGATSIPSDGSTNATITAYALDANHALIQGASVAFTATSGGVGPPAVVTDASGAAQTTLSTAGDPTLRTITVTATVGGQSATVKVQVVAAASGTSVQLGSGAGANFQPDVIGISNASLSAGGSTTLTVALVQSDGTLYTQSTPINFSSNCIASGTAATYPVGSTAPATSVTTTTGVATITYVAKGCAGADIITATATVGSTGLSAEGVVTVAQASIGSLVFVSATPTNIALKGMGVSGRPESATVIFQVLDTAGGPRQGATVNFALDTTVGGISLQPASATAISDAQGNAQIVVNAGTVSTAVRVTASTTLPDSTVISTQSSELTITTGIPTANNFSMAIECANIEGLTYDGATTTVTASMSDRFQNPVPDGTAVTFHAKAGSIGSQCTTATSGGVGGVCSVTYRSQGQRPTGVNVNSQSVNGLVPLLATAIGEESFIDTNGNGYLDTGEKYFSIGEPFENDAWLFSGGAPQYSSTDPTGSDWYYDFLDKGVYQPADSLFHGVLCNAGADCGTPDSWGIGATGTIILSGTNPTITNADGSPASITAMTAGGAGETLTLWIRDANGNVMPGQTTISASATGSAAVTVTPSSTITVPCYNPSSDYYPGVETNGLTTFSWGLTPPSSAGSGYVQISVTTPTTKTNTLLDIPYTVN